MRFAQEFNFPPNLAVSQRVVFLKQIVGKYKKEAVYLRKTASQGKTRQGQLEKEIEIWKDKYQKVKQERDQFKKENGQLKTEIERLTKTNSRYQVSLFDHGNFKSPDNGEKKPKGGQLNHPDTNREGQADFSGYESFGRKRIYASSCGKCGSNLERVNATKEKVSELIKILSKKGYDIIYIDIIASEIRKYGVKVVKVIIPQLQPLHLDEKYPYLTFRRLYQAPVDMGVLKRAKTLKELNQIPHPFL